MDIEVLCNTPDEILLENIRANIASQKDKPWIKLEPPHDGHAVICGSGPSLLDTLDLIRWRVKEGQTVFALNNAANVLGNNGVIPDYQVIVDARPQTATLLGKARKHLFCSQVDPSLFDERPDAVLFHPAMEELDQMLGTVAKDKEFALIGGGTTSGIVSMCLAYTMGYRKLHLFGFDSSHKDGRAHAVHQQINDFEPWSEWEFNGRTYKASIAMVRQAELFFPVSNQLIDLGCTITIDGYGLLPDAVRASARIEMSEREKYQRMWRFEQYRHLAPGEHLVELFLEIAQPEKESRVIDFGCGTGRASVKLAEKGLRPLLVDFVENSRDPEAMELPFIQADLKNLPDGIYSNFGFCTDVLEHIETADVPAVIESIMGHCRACFFQVSLVPDNCGQLIGQTLHLTVKPFEWWLDMFFSLGLSLKHAKNDGNTATFYATR